MEVNDANILQVKMTLNMSKSIKCIIVDRINDHL